MTEQGDSQPIVERAKPESAAVAGIVYALCAGASLLIINGFPLGLSEAGWRQWIEDAGNRQSLYVALMLAGVSAIAFLWFVAVIRRRLGDREDKFFATVFFGSSLVYVGLWLVAASLVASPSALKSLTDQTLGWDSYLLIQGFGYGIVSIAVPRVQAIFVASTSVIVLRTGALPRWLGFLGIALAVVMFILPILWTPIGFGLPAFVAVTSVAVFFTRRLTEAPGE